MRFGVMLLPRALEETRSVAQHAESLGFSWVSVADTPTVYEESYLHQLEVARATESVMVGPMVSHLVIRHPVIVGNLLSTLNRFTNGRVIGTLATGNSAARGLGLKPLTIDRLEEGTNTIRSYWRGEGGKFGESMIPVSGIERDGCPLYIAADGPKAAELAGRAGDGLLYGGTMDPEVTQRRLDAAQAGAGGKQAWIAPTVSLCENHDDVRDDLGAMVVAMANRAMRGDLTERGVPEDIQADVLEMRKAYDYGFHADNTRPRNTGVVSDRLASHLIDALCLWGDEARWGERIAALEEQGWDGIMFIMGQGEQVSVVQDIGKRLHALGVMSPKAAV